MTAGESVDFVVIGSGAAGSVLARRVAGLLPAADRLVWNGAPMFRSFESLPVALTSEPRRAGEPPSLFE